MNEPIYERMQQLIRQIRQADTAYYKHDAPIMSDLKYDRLMDDLVALEEDSGVILSNSPTQHVAGETLETLAEVRHTKPMLSAAKTKSVDDLIRFAAGQDVLLSWKMDGLTLVLRYENGHLLAGHYPRPRRYHRGGRHPHRKDLSQCTADHSHFRGI